MAHPETVTVEQRAKYEHLSPLMRAKAKSSRGEKVNACPFGCDIQSLDDHGYCRHLVGFTTDGKTYEPMVVVGGKRVVRVPMEDIPDQLPVNAALGEEVQKRPVYPEVLGTDKLVKITVSSRVYRDVDGSGEKMRKRQEEEARQRRIEEKRALIEDLRNDPDFRKALLEDLSKPDGELVRVNNPRPNELVTVG